MRAAAKEQHRVSGRRCALEGWFLNSARGNGQLDHDLLRRRKCLHYEARNETQPATLPVSLAAAQFVVNYCKRPKSNHLIGLHVRKRRAGVIRDPLIVVMVGGTKSGPIVELMSGPMGTSTKLLWLPLKVGGCGSVGGCYEQACTGLIMPADHESGPRFWRLPIACTALLDQCADADLVILPEYATLELFTVNPRWQSLRSRT